MGCTFPGIMIPGPAYYCFWRHNLQTRSGCIARSRRSTSCELLQRDQSPDPRGRRSRQRNPRTTPSFVRCFPFPAPNFFNSVIARRAVLHLSLKRLELRIKAPNVHVPLWTDAARTRRKRLKNRNNKASNRRENTTANDSPLPERSVLLHRRPPIQEPGDPCR